MNWKLYLCKQVYRIDGDCYLGGAMVSSGLSGYCEGCRYNIFRYMIPGSKWWKNKTGTIYEK